jgi:hypothetical protein
MTGPNCDPVRDVYELLPMGSNRFKLNRTRAAPDPLTIVPASRPQRALPLLVIVSVAAGLASREVAGQQAEPGGSPGATGGSDQLGNRGRGP